MRVTVESIEVATLKPDGRPWDGPGGPRMPKAELAGFFALDLTRQLERLVTTGEAPNPPEVFVRIFAGPKLDQLFVETDDEESFDPSWSENNQGDAALAVGQSIRIQVWDRDVLSDDLIGETTLPVPSPATLEGGRWKLAPFGQVRRLLLRLEAAPPGPAV